MKILIAEDDVVSRRVLELMLTHWEHEVSVAIDGEAALQALQTDDAPPLAILDVMMPGIDGFEVCRRVRASSQKEVSPYIILLTAKAQREEIIEGLTAGADDYLIKPYNADEMRARLNCGVRIVELQKALAERVRELEATNDKLRSAEIELRNLSLTDDLTKLYNRRGFFALAQQAQNAARRNQQQPLLFYFDMDNLKSINDQYGHNEGSRALIGVAECLRRTFRTSDIVARLGGDEFAALVSNAGGEAAEAITARFEAALDEETKSGNYSLPLSVSVGFVTVEPTSSIGIDEYMQMADEYMYAQKRDKKVNRL